MTGRDSRVGAQRSAPSVADDPRVVRSRAAIVEAATEQFVRHGYLAVSLDEVAELAGVAKRTIYNVYGGKEDLFRAALGDALDTAERFSREIAAPLGDAADPEAELHETGLRLARAVLDGRIVPLRRLLIGEATRFPELARDYYERAPGRVMAAIAAALHRFDERGLLRVPDPEVAAEQFAFLVLGAGLDRALFDPDAVADRRRIDTRARAGVETFLRAHRGGAAPAPARPPAFDADRLGHHRRELVAYCYRMLGSTFEAQDAAQEVLLRAWRNGDRFDERRGSYRTWLYAIATNVCLDQLRARRRRQRAEDVVAPAAPGDPLGEALPPERWLEPLPDALVTGPDDDPATVVATRDSVRLAFVAALQHLVPRQRAVLILREVLGFSAAEVAEQLGTSVPAVNSTLQRARARLADRDVTGEPADPTDARQRRLLERYQAAFETQDYDTLVTLLRDDASMSMPPLTWWLRGREDVAAAWRGDPAACEGTRLVATVANGSPAFAQYVWSDELGEHEPRSVTALELVEGRIQRITVFLATEVWFPLFGLSSRAPTGRASSTGSPRRR